MFDIAADSLLTSSPVMPVVRYANHTTAWGGFGARIRQLATQPDVSRVCEVGGGANPLLPLDFIARHRLQVTILDISRAELDKAPAGYQHLCADITAPEPPRVEAPFQLIFSRMLAEHVASAEQFHRNILDLLAPGGVAVHFFPTLYSVPFLVNRVLPEWLSGPLLRCIQPIRRQSGAHAKFPAFYDWCRGPSSRQLQRFQQIGYVVQQYCGYFGHAYYDRLPPLHIGQRWLAATLERRPVPLLTSFAQVTLSRPA